MAANGNGHRIARWVVETVTPYVHAERVDERGEVARPRGLHAAGVRLNQALIEAGRTPPWVYSPEVCHEIWMTREVGGPDNDPFDYAHKDPGIIDLMHRFWQPEVTLDSSILELGCNAGGNLVRLHELGYRKLMGIDINPHALDTLRREHPALAADAELRLGTFEETLPTLESDSVDCVYTMAVGIHIHPASHNVFGEMARIARRNICVIESEIANAGYTFARNYRRVFERLGCTQIREESIDKHSHPEVDRVYDGYVARLFRVNGR